VIAGLAAGVTAAVALGAAASSPDTSTDTTSAGAAGATTTTASSKVWVCHHTGSWKHPYHLIHISTHALPAHMRHGNFTTGADKSCPTTQPSGAKTRGRGNGQNKSAKTKNHNPGKGDNETETDDQ
jgi:hypothetical protein